MTAKTYPNTSMAPDGSQYVTLTDGSGNLVTTGNITIGTTPISGGATTQVLFNLGSVVSSDSGLTYSGSGGTLTVPNSIQFAGSNPGVIRSVASGNVYIYANSTFFALANGTGGAFLAPNATTGILTLADNTGSDFARLTLGGTTSSFPSMKRSAAKMAFRLADDSADAQITVDTVNYKAHIVSGLPTAAVAGQITYVTDATQTAITGLGLTVVGGGANKVMVYSDGTNWLIL